MISRIFASIAATSIGAIAASQTLPPPNYGGQSYWFGPGPSAYTLDSTSQTDGGYVEQSSSGGVWTANGGGPAFLGNEDHGTFMRTYFGMTTSLVIQPYIYVDGYFSTTASVHGFTGGTLDVGTSKFYVLHNVGIVIGTISVGDLWYNTVGNPPMLETVYNFEVTNYASPSTYTDTFSANGGSSFADRTYNLADTGGIMEVSVQRDVAVPANAQAGSYVGIGTIYVSST